MKDLEEFQKLVLLSDSDLNYHYTFQSISFYQRQEGTSYIDCIAMFHKVRVESYCCCVKGVMDLQLQLIHERRFEVSGST